MKNIKKIVGVVAFLSLVTSLTLALNIGSAKAVTPALTINNLNNGQIQIATYGDANSTAVLYDYQPGTSNAQYVANLGTTNQNGNLTTVVSTTAYSIPSGSTVYVLINGQQSAVSAWPYSDGYNNGYYNNGGALTFSQSNISVSQGQSMTVSVYGNNSGSYTITSNSNPTAVSASMSGSSVNIYASAAGASTLTVCPTNSYYGNSSGCGYLYVTVIGNSNGYYNGNNYNNYNNYNYGTVYLSQTSEPMVVGQSVTVTASGSGSYYIASNSNPSVVSASVNGSSINLYGSSVGASTLSICSSSNGSYNNYYNNNYNSAGSCVTLYVGVQAPYTYYQPQYQYPQYNQYNQYPLQYQYQQNNTLVLNAGVTSSLNVDFSSTGSSYTVPISGSAYGASQYGYNYGYQYGQYYISSNSNPNVVSAYISGSSLMLRSTGFGGSNITVCQSGTSVCGSVYAAVSGNSSSNYYYPYNNDQYYY